MDFDFRIKTLPYPIEIGEGGSAQPRRKGLKLAIMNNFAKLTPSVAARQLPQNWGSKENETKC